MPNCEERDPEATCKKEGKLDGQPILVIDLEGQVRTRNAAGIMVIVTTPSDR